MKRTYRMNEPSVASESIDGEVVVINLETGTYFSLQNVAGRIWELAARRLTVREMVHELEIHYDAGTDEILKHVDSFLATLVEEQLFVEVEDSNHTDGALTASDSESRQRVGKLPFVAPVLNKFTDMQELLFLDPIHEVDETGWPNVRAVPDNASDDPPTEQRPE